MRRDQCYKNITFSVDTALIRDTMESEGGVDMNALLGSRIKALRTAKNYTQEQIADSLGISRQKYARVENGTNSITLDILAKIAEMLDVTVGDITRVLDEEPTVAYRAGTDGASSEKIFDMLDLFYANKHMYMRLQHRNRA